MEGIPKIPFPYQDRRTNGNHNGFARFYFNRPLWMRAAFFGVMTFAVGLLLDKAVHLWGLPHHWTWLHERLFENSVEGLFIGYVAYGLIRLREQRLTRRMKEIGYLNHHIRNALQAIELAAYQIKESKEIFGVVYSGVRRITETLAKVQRSEDVDLDAEEGHGDKQKPSDEAGH